MPKSCSKCGIVIKLNRKPNDPQRMRNDKERDLEEYEEEYISRLKGGTKTTRIKKTTKLVRGQKGAHWENKNIDLKQLADKLVDFFYADGFSEVRQEESSDETKHIVQAKKGGALRTLSSTRKAITIVIRGDPNDFQVEVGTGEWGKGVAVAVVLTGLIGIVGLGFNAAFRQKVWTEVRLAVKSLEDTASTNSKTKSTSKRDVLKTTKASKNSAKKNETSVFCDNCGSPMKHTAKFCRKCGSKV